MRPAMDASMKILLGATIIVVTIAMFLWNSVPRLMRDVWHARDFILAQSHTMTDYKCTNWNGVMFNECTATFVSSQGARHGSLRTGGSAGRQASGPGCCSTAMTRPR